MAEEMLSYITTGVHGVGMSCEAPSGQADANSRLKVTAFAPLSVTLVTLSRD